MKTQESWHCICGEPDWCEHSPERPKPKELKTMKTQIRHKVVKNGKIKSYVDKRWCYCELCAEPHIHQKDQNQRSLKP